MSATITANDTTGDQTTPTLILGYESDRESRNIIHDLIGGGIAVSLIAPRPRSGTITLFYPTEADAFAALELHSRETTFTLVDTDVPAVGMTYVLDGSVTIALDDTTRVPWTLAVAYQEIEP